MVLPPMRDNWLISASEAMPVTSEENTKGTAMSLSRLTKIVPKGTKKGSGSINQ